MYGETDGDTGFYAIELFSTSEKAEEYKKFKDNPYGDITEIVVDEKEVNKPVVENVKCPTCGGDMISRKGQYGTFWGCKKYPSCRGTRDSMGRSKEEREKERENEKSSENNTVLGSPSERYSENDKFRFRKS